MRRDLLIYSILLVCGLALAYYVSLPSNLMKVDFTEWTKLDKKSVQKIKLEGKDLKVVVTKRPDRDDYWVVADKINPNGEAYKESFKANMSIDSLISFVSPLYVVRVIGKVEEDQLPEYGLTEDTPVTFTATASNSKNIVLKLGSRPYASPNSYALDTNTNNVILFEATELDKLRDAEYAFYSRDVVDAPFDKVTTAEVSYKDKTKTITKIGKNDKNGTFEWSDEGEAGQNKASWATWLDKIAKLQLTKYIQADEEETVSQLPVLATIKFLNKNNVVDEIKILKSEDGKNYYVTSNYLGSYATSNFDRLDSLMKDLDSL